MCVARTCIRRYLNHPESDFEGFRPRGEHTAPVWVKFGVVTRLHTKFHPPSVHGRGEEPLKLKNLRTFGIQTPHLLREFYEIFRVCGKSDRLAINI